MLRKASAPLHNEGPMVLPCPTAIISRKCSLPWPLRTEKGLWILSLRLCSSSCSVQTIKVPISIFIWKCANVLSSHPVNSLVCLLVHTADPTPLQFKYYFSLFSKLRFSRKRQRLGHSFPSVLVYRACIQVISLGNPYFVSTSLMKLRLGWLMSWTVSSYLLQDVLSQGMHILRG